MDIPEACVQKHFKPKFEVHEKRSKVEFDNPGRLEIHQVAIDGCVIVEDERCDWLVNIPELATSLLIELKGSDLDKAFRQLQTTHRHLVRSLEAEKFWIISYSGKPGTNTTIQNMRKRAKASHQATLMVGSSPYRHKLARQESQS